MALRPIVDGPAAGVAAELRRWAGLAARRTEAGGGDVEPGRGLVETFSREQMSGWVAVEPGAAPVRISLHLGDVEVAATWAAVAADPDSPDGKALPPGREIRRFDLRLRDVWAYVKRRDRLTVRADDARLPIQGHGRRFTPSTSGPQSLAALRARLEAGEVFDQNGVLHLSKKLDSAWQERVFALYERIGAVLKETHGYDAFLMYGSALGAVREGGVIGHDVDFDMAYLSECTDGPAAAAELRALAGVFLDRGLDVDAARSALHIHDADDPDARVDLFHLYFDAEGLLCAPFGVAGRTEFRRSDWHGLKEIGFCGRRGAIPLNDEQFVEFLYGPGWRSPKPGFDWDRERTKRDRSGLLRDAWRNEIYWACHYAHHVDGALGPSPFAMALLARPDLPKTVLDLGCGDGRDSVAFAAAGRSVVGLDRTARAIELAEERAAVAGVAARTRFAVADVANARALRAQLGAALAAAEGPVLFYLRFLLHALTTSAQRALLDELRDSARPGDLVAAEFRTAGDKGRPKAIRRYHRRFQDREDFWTDLGGRGGWRVLVEQEGTGLACFEQEDAYVYRVLLEREPDQPPS